MALHKLAFLLLLLAIIDIGLANENKEHSFLQSQTPVRMPLVLKLSHFRFYFHEIVSGQNPSAIQVAHALTNTSAASASFGVVSIMDDALTAGPEATSELVGRAQGLYALASSTGVSLLMVMNFAFMAGKYNGSTIAVTGRNSLFNEVRELSIVGGSGLFRLARGYVQLRTHTFNLKTGDAVVEYNVFVEHY